MVKDVNKINKMIYKAYLIQDGEGCDYTIGCGLQVIDIESDNLVSAQKELNKIILDEYSHYESRLFSAELYEINLITEVDLGVIYSAEEERLKTNKIGRLKEQRDEIAKEIERLNKMYD